MQRDANVVGTWTRRLVLLDGHGNLVESETTWRFDPDGDALRLQVARNWTVGIVDSLRTLLRWRTAGDRLTITFPPPDSADVEFRYRVLADTLSLDELRFVRR